MKIYIGADHRGFELKEKIKDYLKSKHLIEDLGANELVSHDDFTDYAESVGRKVSMKEGSRGIIICGSGAGVDIATNKIKGIRSFIGFNIEQVKAARNDDDVNILALAADYISFDEVKILTDTFLNTDFNPTENHVRRINKIKELET